MSRKGRGQFLSSHYDCLTGPVSKSSKPQHRNLAMGCGKHPTHRPLSSSFLGLPYRILNISHKKELLRGRWVNPKPLNPQTLNPKWSSALGSESSSSWRYRAGVWSPQSLLNPRLRPKVRNFPRNGTEETAPATATASAGLAGLGLDAARRRDAVCQSTCGPGYGEGAMASLGGTAHGGVRHRAQQVSSKAQRDCNIIQMYPKTLFQPLGAL